VPNERSTRRKARAPRRAARVPKSAEPRTLIAYQIHEDDSARIRAARRERPWIEETPNGKYAYRCLPLVIANQYGWEILSTHHLRARWDGSSGRDGVVIEHLSGDGPVHAHAHFGLGVLTFQVPFLFKTPPGWNLMVRGPMNRPKDGIVGLDGVVETDWSHSTFTMNWRFTRACTVEFAIGEPICHVFPVQRGAVESFRAEVRMLDSEPELSEKLAEWSRSRDWFLWALGKEKPDIVAQGWQKDYLLAAKDKKLLASEFVDHRAVIPPNGQEGNHKKP
jgi:hypothetical protein